MFDVHKHFPWYNFTRNAEYISSLQCRKWFVQENVIRFCCKTLGWRRTRAAGVRMTQCAAAGGGDEPSQFLALPVCYTFPHTTRTDAAPIRFPSSCNKENTLTDIMVCFQGVIIAFLSERNVRASQAWEPHRTGYPEFIMKILSNNELQKLSSLLWWVEVRLLFNSCQTRQCQVIRSVGRHVFLPFVDWNRQWRV